MSSGDPLRYQSDEKIGHSFNTKEQFYLQREVIVMLLGVMWQPADYPLTPKFFF